MTLLVAIAIPAVFGSVALLTSSDRAISWTVAVAGLIGTALAGQAVAAQGSIVVAGVSLEASALVRLWLVTLAVAGTLTSIVGLAAGSTPRLAGMSLVVIAIGGLALATATDPISLAVAAAAGLGTAAIAPTTSGTRELRAVVTSIALVLLAGAFATAAGVAGAPSGLAASAQGPASAADIPGAGIVLLGVAAAVGIRLCAVPVHRRAARAAEDLGLLGVPLLVALAPAFLAVVAGGWVGARYGGGQSLGAERLIIVAAGGLTVLLGAVAAWIQDDLRHLLAYTMVANGGIVLLGLAAASGPNSSDALAAATTWALIAVLVAFGLAAGLATLEAAFGTLRVGELSGWVRRMPVLAVAIALGQLASVGLPGVGSWTVRSSVADAAVGRPFAVIVILAGLASALPIVRLLATGLAKPGTRVRMGASERPRRPIAVDAAIPGRHGIAGRASDSVRDGQARLVEAWSTNRAPAASIAVLALCVLALLVSLDRFGVEDAGRAGLPSSIAAPAVVSPGPTGPTSTASVAP